MITNYDRYQDKRQTKRQTNDRQPTDNLTDNRQQYNNNNNINNGTNNKGIGGIPPTLEEIQTYITEIGSSIDPGKFFDHYSSCGWILKGGQKMKDWKATVRNWERREKSGQSGQTGTASGGKGSAGSVKPDYRDPKSIFKAHGYALKAAQEVIDRKGGEHERRQ